MKHLTALILILTALNISAQDSLTLSPKQRKQLATTLTGHHWYGFAADSVAVLSATQKADEVEIRFTESAKTTLISAAKLQQLHDSIVAWFPNTQKTVFSTASGITLKSYLPEQQTFTRQKGKPLLSLCESKNGNLYGRNIALWSSHGYYYERTLNRWEWQRARLFTTVEDLLSASFAIEFLLPMLENAGANVFVPRERDMQMQLYIADNSDTTCFRATKKPFAKAKGYSQIKQITGSENPFTLGTAETYNLQSEDSIIFKINNIASRKYYVYVCYEQNESNSDNATYTVKDKWGERKYAVNQQRGGGMWICLGQHEFDGEAQVILRGEGQISADAVRLGGGMGIVARGEATSKMPRYAEAARYYLQTDGFDAAVYSPSTKRGDYIDDVNCHGEWVNALKNSKNIDIDLAIALHTDAFKAGGDSTIGTLAIVKYEGQFSDGKPRRASRDVAYQIETQIASDLRQTWDTAWTTRGIWHKNYSESLRPDCPSLILEMLSHQNLNDVRYSQHPQFRFDICRAVYKGIVRWLEGEKAVIQPLAVKSFGLERIAADSLRLTWQPTHDPLESSAKAEDYLIYANGQHIATTCDTSFCLRQKPNGNVVEYTIRARNAGGISFASKGLCAALQQGTSTLLFVDGADRVSAPAIVKTAEYAGIDLTEDPGVAWHDEMLRTGSQYDYSPQSEWIDDDCPGHGASFADEEGTIRRGACASQRDTIQALASKGYSVVSQSKSFFENHEDTTQYAYYHIFLGMQRTTWYGQMEVRHSIYTPAFMARLTRLCAYGAKIDIGGYYVGTDLQTTEQKNWATEYLGFKHITNHASRTGEVVGHGSHLFLPMGKNNGWPDAIAPANSQSRTILRYADTNMSAAIEYKNVRVFGF